jgi:hypothetical protein
VPSSPTPMKLLVLEKGSAPWNVFQDVWSCCMGLHYTVPSSAIQFERGWKLTVKETMIQYRFLQQGSHNLRTTDREKHTTITGDSSSE